MANTRNEREASEYCIQEARRLLNEVLRIDMRVKIMLNVERVVLRQILEWASDKLKILFLKNFQ